MSFKYRHPQADAIIMRTKDILSQSSTGDLLLNNYQGKIDIIAGPASQGFVPSENVIFLSVPAMQAQANVEQALDLAGSLIEHKSVAAKGFPEPDVIQDDETLTYMHHRNLDLILGVFPVAQELEEQGFKAIAELRHAGLSKLYQAWKTGKSHEEYVMIYWNMNKG